MIEFFPMWNGNQEAKNLLDRFPTFSEVSRLMQDIRDFPALGRLFFIAHPLAFLYNFEVLVSEVGVKRIQAGYLIDIFRKGLMLQDHNCVNSILFFFIGDGQYQISRRNRFSIR
jgi:hypothetical protein